jgi:hypothetical protein
MHTIILRYSYEMDYVLLLYIIIYVFAIPKKIIIKRKFFNDIFLHLSLVYYFFILCEYHMVSSKL